MSRRCAMLGPMAFLALMGLVCGGRVSAGEANSEAARNAGPFRLVGLPNPADVTPKPVATIEPGSIVEKDPPRNWSHVVLVAYTRVGAGDLQDAPGLAVSIAQRFTVAIVANVRAVDEGSVKAHYLDRVGVGIGTKINGKNTIITSDTQATLGANLGIIERQVLSATEKGFATGCRQVARTATMLVFDADSMLLIAGEHRSMVTRYVFLVSREGELGVLSWILEPSEAGDYRLYERPMQYLTVPMTEDRVLNVKADKFFLGIPAADAFAQVKPTTGTPVPWTDNLRAFGARREYSADGITQFEAELWKLWGKN